MSHETDARQGADKRVLLACEMLEDEVRAALSATGAQFDEIMWVERGFHVFPDKLRPELQRRIDEAQQGGATQIVLAFGLCGGSAEGLCAQNAILAMPRFDDCVNFLLETGKRCCRGKAKAGVFYLTRGWTIDYDYNPARIYEGYVQRFGQKKADRLMRGMFGAYKAVSLIDDGCYELENVAQPAREAADALGVGVRCDAGSNVVLEKLLSGDWDDDILVCEPGRRVLQSDFEYTAVAW